MTFERQPTLIGELVQLRPLTKFDFDALSEVASDPLLWEQHPARNRYQKANFEKFFEESINSGGALLALDHSTGRAIGSSRYHAYDEAAAEIEIGWTFLARSYWGGQYNGEMKSLMMQHAFQFVDSVIFLVGVDNLRSQRAVEKIGGVRDGIRKDATGVESYLYRIQAIEFK